MHIAGLPDELVSYGVSEIYSDVQSLRTQSHSADATKEVSVYTP